MSWHYSNRPVIILTGASGFIGRHFIEAFHEVFYIYALARCSQKEAGVRIHRNIEWIRLDIGHPGSVEKVFKTVAERGGADFIIHLAGYYDFDGKDCPEYERTNVNGTRYILEAAQRLDIRRFIFASSLTVSRFDTPGTVINEKSPADAQFNYAVSKRKGEEMVRQFSGRFPTAVVRLAAIYSDWCEYGPLYKFLDTWLSKSWKSAILAGRGESAVPYLHVNDLNNFFLKIVENTEQLPQHDIYIASPKGCSSQKQLFLIASRYSSRRQPEPVFMPRWLAFAGVHLLNFTGRITGNPPFEKPWMIKYVDHKLDVEPSVTFKKLGWKPVPRYEINRRLLFLIENMKSNPSEWHRKNMEALKKRRIEDPNLKVYEAMHSQREAIIAGITREMYHDGDSSRFPNYKNLRIKVYTERIRYIYTMFETAIRTGYRIHVLGYARNLASERYKENFKVDEVVDAVQFIGSYIVRTLIEYPELSGLKNQQEIEQIIYDGITLTTQLIIDELEDSFERLSRTVIIFNAGF